MKCPKCKTPDLRAARIDNDLPAAGCTTCSGALVSLLYYRDWAERYQRMPASLALDKSVVEETSDTVTALVCPKCARLMTKYKVSGCVSNRLDVCTGCDEAWLDKGEWELLKALELADKMPLIFTDQWQRNIRKQVAEDNRRNILRKTIGDTALVEVEEFHKWVNENPYKGDILVYLYGE